MGHKTDFLSQSGICAIYKCLDGHIHVKYRSLDITMESEEFFRVAEVFTDALDTLRKVSEPVDEEINLRDLSVTLKA